MALLTNSQSDAGGSRILIADDDPAAIKLLERHLAPGGYDILVAHHGLEALHLVLTEQPAMMITDWCMPQMDGLELCRTLRAEPSAGFVYIIVTSAFPDEDRMVEALDAGADDFLVKPISRNRLLARVRAGQRIVDLHRDLERRNRDVHRINVELAVSNRRLNTLATIDDLTGVFNRREAMAHLAEVWTAGDRYQESLSCVLLDIDGFKVVNDTFGHAVGDQVLKQTGKILRDTSRAGEAVCRTGGEEFLIVCPKSDAQTALSAAERVRQAIVANNVRCAGRDLSVTVSLGVAQRDDHMSGPDDLLRAADEALYAAKRAGKNRACLAGPGSEPAIVGLGPEPREQPADDAVTVLVMGADVQTRAVCREVIGRLGYHVHEAVDGEAGLTAIKEHQPAVILLDGDMPDMDGRDCARRLKADPYTRDIPIIMMGPGQPKDDVLAGGDDYMAKPLGAQELALRIDAMARLHGSMEELQRSNAARGEQARRLNLLLDLSQCITVAEDLEVILERTATTVAELTLCKKVAILLAEPDGQNLRVAFAYGLDAAAAGKARVPLGRGTVGKAFSTGTRQILAPGQAGPADLAMEDPALRLRLPMVCNPLIASECTVGVLVTAEPMEGDDFSTRQLQYIDMVCNLAASAIQENVTRQDRDDARNSVVEALTTLAECRDNDTGRHLERVTRYSVMLAEHLRRCGPYGEEIDDHFLANLRRAVPLHDIGKVGTPDHILFKAGSLDDAEMNIMKTHAELGAQTIRAVMSKAPGTGFLVMAEQIAASHHEWHDGSGYPCGLVGAQIPLCARLTAVADVYDALTTRRPYKEPFSHDKSVQIITEGSGTHFDPHLVEAFLAREQEFAALAAELADETVGQSPERADSRTAEKRVAVSAQ
ncbi:MAG: diguanylate cyclase [Phycisphaerae bacterium]